MSIYTADDRLDDLIYIDEDTQLPCEYDSDADQSMKISYLDYSGGPSDHSRKLSIHRQRKSGENDNMDTYEPGVSDKSTTVQGTKRIYYPGPIPRELSLPPLLSNREPESITNINRVSISAKDTLEDFLTTNIVTTALKTEKIQQGSLLSISLARTAEKKKTLIYDGQKRQTTLLQEYCQLNPKPSSPLDKSLLESPQRSPKSSPVIEDIPLALRFKSRDDEVLAQRKERLMRQKEDVPLAFVKLRLGKAEMVNQWRTGID